MRLTKGYAHIMKSFFEIGYLFQLLVNQTFYHYLVTQKYKVFSELTRDEL